MLPPEDSEQSKSGSGFPSRTAETEYPLEQLTSTLAAHGAGAISADLALDLILNDIVEQACLATGATGAAIALLRGEEMVCRASSGEYAPGLGIRLDVRSGLPAACVQTGEVQLCVDAENDPRMDIEACQEAGIRSILMIPVVESGQVFGILEVFSSRSNAFGELDIITVQALAHQVVENRRHARETKGKLEAQAIQPPALEREGGNESVDLQTVIRAEDPVQESATVAPAETNPAGIQGGAVRQASPPTDFWTSFLAVLVVGAVVMMGALLGWRLGWGRGHGLQGASHARISGTKVTPAAAAVPSVTASSQAGGLEMSKGNATNPASSATSEPLASAARGTAAAESNSLAGPPPGGLVVYDRGKVIYRLPPASPTEAKASEQTARTNGDAVVLAGKTTRETTAVAEDLAAERLIHVVAPLYPPTAAQRGLQGPVVLDAEINRQGKVEKLTVVNGDPELAAAARQAVRQWRYKPFMQNGRPVGMRTTITVNFTIPAK